VESDGVRVAVVLNGLGSVKTEELYVVYRSVARLLGEHGIEIVGPEVGEFVTSFEMAGCSLSLCWLTPELADLWNAPAYTSAYKKGAIVIDSGLSATGDDGSPAPSGVRIVVEESALQESVESRRAVSAVARAFDLAPIAIADARDELGRLDSVAGDGYHGIGMMRGVMAASVAACDAAQRGRGIGSVLRAAGEAWSEHAGGTSGALWGIGLEAVAKVLGDEDAPTVQTAAASARAAVDAIAQARKATAGDKTMLDAMLPFAVEIENAAAQGVSLRVAWDRAALSAQRAADDTTDLLPRRGRARPHAHKSVGTPDPGAVSFAILARAVLGRTGTVTEESGSANERIE
jgi:dihydroxyacetone kinase